MAEDDQPENDLNFPNLLSEFLKSPVALHDGQFQTVWKTSGMVVGDAWSDFLPGSQDVTADWMKPLACGNYNVKSGKCSGQNYK